MKIDDLRRLYNDQRKKIARLEKWIDDCQSGMYINCVYCGHRYGPNTETSSMRDVLKQHIEQCPEHPMSQLRSEVEWLQGITAKLHPRVTKLVEKGRRFIVVGEHEPYFTDVYRVIREVEQCKGTWTDECEQAFQDVTHYDARTEFPKPTEELAVYLRDYAELYKFRREAAVAEGRKGPRMKHG